MPHTILILAANPKDTQSLRLGEELREVLAHLQHAKYAEHLRPSLVLAARPEDVGRAMLEGRPRIVHFAGHGEGAGGIVLENDAGETQLASTQALQRLFQTFAGQVDCVVLNACYSQEQAAAIAAHVPVVVGMRQAVSDATATAFATAFYQAIGNGESYRMAFDYALRLVELKALEGDIPQLNLREGAAELSLFRPGARPELPLPEDNPYLGLAAFQDSDSHRFFGRCALTLHVFEALEALQTPNPRLFCLLGPSGSGKSSLARAGLMPVLRAEWNALALVLQPTDRPLEALARALAEFDSQGATVSRAKHDYLALLAEPDGLRSILSDLLAHRPQPLVLLLDQFEETFTLCRERAQRQAFIDALLNAAQDAHTPVWVILTLRSDFLGETQAHPALNQWIARQSLIVPTLQPAELRDAIERPAQAAGYPLDAPTVSLLLEQSADRPGALPLLQFALQQIWNGMVQGVPPAVTLENIGGVGGALAQTAETLFKALSEAEQHSVRRMFLKLVQLGEGSRDTRRRAEFSEMVAHGEDAAAVQAVLQRFAGARARLLSLSGENFNHEAHEKHEEKPSVDFSVPSGKIYVEFTHEALLEHWARLNEWLDAGREDLRFERRINDAARHWRDNRQSPGFLWAAPEQLGLLRQYHAKHGADMTAAQLEFFHASVRELERRQRNQRLSLAAVMLLLFALAAGAWLYAREQAAAQREQQRLTAQAETNLVKAEEQRRQALLNQSRYLADQARQLNEKDLAFTAMRLALEALPGISETDPRRPFLHESQQQLYQAVETHWRGVLEHDAEVRGAELSADGAVLLTWAGNNAYLWDAHSGALRHTLSGHEDSVVHAAYSPAGDSLVTSSDDNTARLWDARSGALLHTLSGHEGEIYHAAYSPAGDTLVTASVDKTARLWDARSGALRHTLSGHESWVVHAAYSPAGDSLVTASYDNTAKLWDARSGILLHTLTGHEDMVYHAVFSPTGDTLVTASVDKTAKLWDARSGALLHTLSGHEDSVVHAAYSPAGDTLVTASWDKTARLWDALGGALRHTLSGHENSVLHAAYSPAGDTLVTASEDGTARLWDARSGALLYTLSGHEDRVVHAAYSPAADTLVTASHDNTAKLWDARSGALLHTLSGHESSVLHAAYSPAGDTLVTASSDKTARLWDAHSGVLRHTLSGHQGAVVHAAYSPAGDTLVTASYDNTARLWDARSGALLYTLSGHEGAVYHAAYSPAGDSLVTASSDDTARLWPVFNSPDALLQAARERLPPRPDGTPGWLLTCEERRAYFLDDAPRCAGAGGGAD